MGTFVAYCDGGCFGNGKNGARAYGSFAVYRVTEELFSCITTQDPNARLAAHLRVRDEAELVVHKKVDLPMRPEIRATNNYAEMSMVFTLLSFLRSEKLLRKGNTVRICMDSELVLKQLKKQYKVKNVGLKLIYDNITALVKRVVDEEGCGISNMVELMWVPGTLMKETILEH